MSDRSVLVSVIIPVFRGESCILGAIDSARNQTHRNLEVIVIDDGSDDGTWPILESIYDQRVRVFRQPNRGAAAARNLGLEHASGEYIAFLDADDRWLPHKLASELDALAEANLDIGIAYSWFYAVDEKGELLHRSPAITFCGPVFDDLTQGHAFILPSASLFHRDIFSTIGGFDAARRYHEDFAFVLRACRTFPAFPARQYSVVYKQSMTGKGRAVMRDYNVALDAAISVASDLSDVLTLAELQQLRNNQKRALYFRFLMYGFNASAQRLLRESPEIARRHGIKGWVGWIFAKTGLNLMLPIRLAAHGWSRTIHRTRWRHFLKRANITMRDERRSNVGQASLVS